MTPHAPLRSQWTKAKSVCHVLGLGDGDSPTSPSKDTRLEAVRCKALLGMVYLVTVARMAQARAVKEIAPSAATGMRARRQSRRHSRAVSSSAMV